MFIKEMFYFLYIDSKEIINNSIQNYVLKLFKKRKNKESDVKRTKKPVNTPIKNDMNLVEKVCENVPLSSSGNLLYLDKEFSCYIALFKF